MNDKVIYYDSECGLCNNLVRLILHIDSKKKFYFSPISLLVNNTHSVNRDSIALSINNKLYFEGRAIIVILDNLDFEWRLLGKIIAFLPINFVNGIYRLIAINRKRLTLYKTKVCYNIPSNLKSRFILDYTYYD